MHTLRILTLLISISAFLSCTKEEPAEAPWHGIERSVRYYPQGEDFVINNGERRFNRALYGTNTGFRIEAGDRPEFALYLPGMGGNLKFGIGSGDSSIWIINAQQITARYRPGSMIYEIHDPMIGPGELNLHLLAMNEGEGLILRMQAKDIANGIDLFWAYGGATGKKFSRDGDIGADPESSFYLKPKYCMDNEFDISGNSFTLYFGSGRIRTEAERYENRYTPSEAEIRASMLRDKKRLYGLVPPGGEIRISDARKQESPGILFRSERENEGVISGRIPLQENEDLYFIIALPSGEPSISLPDTVYEIAPFLFNAAEKARQEIAGRIRVHTPDPYINNFGAALGVAADAIWGLVKLVSAALLEMKNG